MSEVSSTDTLIAAAIQPPVVATCDCLSSLMVSSGIEHQLLLLHCDGLMEWLLDKINDVS
jgi:hypothetical protein